MGFEKRKFSPEASFFASKWKGLEKQILITDGKNTIQTDINTVLEMLQKNNVVEFYYNLPRLQSAG